MVYDLVRYFFIIYFRNNLFDKISHAHFQSGYYAKIIYNLHDFKFKNFNKENSSKCAELYVRAGH